MQPTELRYQVAVYPPAKAPQWMVGHWLGHTDIDRFLDEVLVNVNGPWDPTVRMRMPGEDCGWVARPAYFIAGERGMVEAVADRFDVDGFELFEVPSLHPVDDPELALALAVVFQEVRPDDAPADAAEVLPPADPPASTDLLGTLERSIQDAKAARVARRATEATGR